MLFSLKLPREWQKPGASGGHLSAPSQDEGNAAWRDSKSEHQSTLSEPLSLVYLESHPSLFSYTSH